MWSKSDHIDWQICHINEWMNELMSISHYAGQRSMFALIANTSLDYTPSIVAEGNSSDSASVLCMA